MVPVTERMLTKSEDLVVLLGAGASLDAGIPISAQMISEMEDLLLKKEAWKDYRELYYHIKSAMYYAAGLREKFGSNVLFNIETLVNTLYELERNELHPLYPFIATWNSRFTSLAGGRFERIKSLRESILEQLKQWMTPEDQRRGHYYRGLVNFQKQLNFPLRVFTLNYDLLVEGLDSEEFRIESGFADYGPSSFWDWRRFEENENNAGEINLYLYKLHGSIDWKRDENQNLYHVRQIQRVESHSLELIFGRDFKLEAADPYLFYIYSFREYTFKSRAILAIGYGFGDAHINKIISQALRSDASRRLIVISKVTADHVDEKRHALATGHLEGLENQIVVLEGCAKTFLCSNRMLETLQSHIPRSVEEPF